MCQRAGTVFRHVLAFLLLAALQAGTVDAEWVVPPQREAQIQALLDPWLLDGPVAQGVRWSGLSIGKSSFTFELAVSAPVPQQAKVTVAWEPAGPSLPAATVRLEPLAAPNPELAAAVALLQEKLQRRPAAQLLAAIVQWNQPAVPPPAPRALPLPGAFGLRAAAQTLPVPTWPALTGVLLASGLLALWLRRKSPAAAGAAALLLGGGLGWLYVAAAPIAALGHRRFEVYAQREYFLLTVLLALVTAGWVLLLARGVATFAAAGAQSPARRTVFLAAVVALVAFGVRFGLCDLNLMTDADSGYSRLLAYFGGFGGVHVLLTWLLPASARSDMTLHMQLVRGIASLGPPLLTLVAHRLGLSVRAAFWAGLLLACWPIHAALSASDVLQGPVLTLTLLAMLQWRSVDLTSNFAGFLTLSFAIWARPELALTLAPALGVALPLLAKPHARRVAVLGFLWFAVALGCRWLSFAALDLRPADNLVGLVGRAGWPRSLLADPVLLPWLIPAGLALAVAAIVVPKMRPAPQEVTDPDHPQPVDEAERQVRGWQAALAGSFSAVLGRKGPRKNNSIESQPCVPGRIAQRAHLATQRQASPATSSCCTAPKAWRRALPGRAGAPLVALGFAAIALIFGVASLRCETYTQLEFVRYAAPGAIWLCLLAAAGWEALTSALGQRGARVAMIVITGAIVMLPLLHLDYLGRRYDSSAEAPAFLRAVAHLPPGARLIVPGETRDDGLNPCQRYRLLAAWAQRAQPQLATLTVLCAADWLAQPLPAGGAPVFWFHGTDCQVPSAAVRAADLGACRALEAATQRQIVWQEELDLWHRRAVTASTEPPPPGHTPHYSLHLDRVLLPDAP